jgi:hypothetical protein
MEDLRLETTRRASGTSAAAAPGSGGLPDAGQWCGSRPPLYGKCWPAEAAQKTWSLAGARAAWMQGRRRQAAQEPGKVKGSFNRRIYSFRYFGIEFLIIT